jgi:hypothetical protein
MKSLCNAGVFKPLRRAPNCYLGVANYDGEFGWPDYDQHGRPEHMV